MTICLVGLQTMQANFRVAGQQPVELMFQSGPVGKGNLKLNP
jgi:hypothetical protein